MRLIDECTRTESSEVIANTVGSDGDSLVDWVFEVGGRAPPAPLRATAHSDGVGPGQILRSDSPSIDNSQQTGCVRVLQTLLSKRWRMGARGLSAAALTRDQRAG